MPNSDKNKIAINTYAKIAETYTNSYFNDLSDVPYLDHFIQFLPKGAKVLDVGSGPGQFSQYLQQQGLLVTGIDLSEKMIEIAQQKVPTVPFQNMDMRRLDFPNDSYDGLLVAYSLIHIPTVEVTSTLKGFFRVLKPGGYILFITQKGEADQIINEPFDPTQKMFVNFFTKERLRTILEQVEFEVVFQEEKPTVDANAMSETVIYTIARKSEGK